MSLKSSFVLILITIGLVEINCSNFETTMDGLQPRSHTNRFHLITKLQNRLIFPAKHNENEKDEDKDNQEDSNSNKLITENDQTHQYTNNEEDKDSSSNPGYIHLQIKALLSKDKQEKTIQEDQQREQEPDNMHQRQQAFTIKVVQPQHKHQQTDFDGLTQKHSHFNFFQLDSEYQENQMMKNQNLLKIRDKTNNNLNSRKI